MTHHAAREAVTITQRNKPRFVLMSVEEFARLRAEADPRRVYRTDETPAELAELLMPEIERLIALGETSES